MRANDVKRKNVPDAPGVYFFVGPRKKILYIGKATSLRDRVKSYFNRDLISARGPAIVKMVSEATSVDFEKTDSVLEALIREANLIKKHQPIYNTREKDDKSFNYIVITKEDFPRVMVVRGKDLSEKYPAKDRRYLFGPFPSGFVFKEAMRLIRKLFPYYDTPVSVSEMTSASRAGKLAFNRSIGVYPSEAMSRRDYARTIQHIRLFLEGKKIALLKRLERDMSAYAKAREFEKAHALKRAIFGLKHIQDISLIKREVRDLAARQTFRIEAYDVAHTSGKDTVGVMVVVEDGVAQGADYRKFKIRSVDRPNDIASLIEMLTRRLGHAEWPLPNLIVVDGGAAQMNAAKRALAECGNDVPVVSVVKDERHRPRDVLGAARGNEKDILLANAEAHRFALAYHRKKRNKI